MCWPWDGCQLDTRWQSNVMRQSWARKARPGPFWGIPDLLCCDLGHVVHDHGICLSLQFVVWRGWLFSRIFQLWFQSV